MCLFNSVDEYQNSLLGERNQTVRTSCFQPLKFQNIQTNLQQQKAVWQISGCSLFTHKFNVCSLLHVNYTSIKLFKDNQFRSSSQCLVQTHLLRRLRQRDYLRTEFKTSVDSITRLCFHPTPKKCLVWMNPPGSESTRLSVLRLKRQEQEVSLLWQYCLGGQVGKAWAEDFGESDSDL